MNLYDNAIDVHETADILCQNGKYRMSVYNSCLAMELYLKSKLALVDGGLEFETSHDIVNIYRCLNKRFASKKDLLRVVNFSRKYFNESRYPYAGAEVFTKEFALAFLGYVADVKSYIDDDCIAKVEDLQKKFQK